MKITINGEDFYVSWRYSDFVGKETANHVTRGVITTCTLKRKVAKPEEGKKAPSGIILERSIRTTNADLTSKSADRKITLNKVLASWQVPTKEQIAYIWKTYIASQHGNISNNKMKLKNLIKLVGKLDTEQKEAIRLKFFEQPVKEGVLRKMQPSADAAHA